MNQKTLRAGILFMGPEPSQIHLAYALRIISDEDVYRDTLRLNKIRNIFAHSIRRKHFGDEDIRTLMKNFIFQRPEGMDDPNYFVKIISYIYGHLRSPQQA